jgi:hypothetical protein
MRLEYSSARKSAAPGCYHRIWCPTWSAVIEPHQQVCSPPSRGAAKIKLHAIHDSASDLPHRCFGSQIVPRWRDATRKPTSRHGIFPQVPARVCCSFENGRRQAASACPKSAKYGVNNLVGNAPMSHRKAFQNWGGPRDT